jgi:TolB-like protein
MFRLLPTFLLFIGLVWAETKTIAISYFDNTSGSEQYNALSKGLADMLITDLSNVKSLKIVEREKLESLLKEIDLGEENFINPNTAQKLGKGLGAAYILTGSFLSVEPMMRIDARLVNVETGLIEKANMVEGLAKDFFVLENQLAEQLIKNLNLNVEYIKKEKKNKNVSFDDILSFSKSIDLLDRGDIESASNLIKIILDETPDFEYANDLYQKLLENIQIKRNKIRERLKKRIVELNLNRSEINGQWISDFTTSTISLNYEEKIQIVEYLFNELDFRDNELIIDISDEFSYNIGEFLSAQKIRYLETKKRWNECLLESEFYLKQYESNNASMAEFSYKNILNTYERVLQILVEEKKGRKVANREMKKIEWVFNIELLNKYIRFKDYLDITDYTITKNLFYNWIYYQNVDTLKIIADNSNNDFKDNEALKLWLLGDISMNEYDNIVWKKNSDSFVQLLPNLLKMAFQFEDEAFIKDIFSFSMKYSENQEHDFILHQMEHTYLKLKNQKTNLDFKIKNISKLSKINEKCSLFNEYLKDNNYIKIDEEEIYEVIKCLNHYENNWSDSTYLLWYEMINNLIGNLSKYSDANKKFDSLQKIYKKNSVKKIYVGESKNKNLNELISLLVEHQKSFIIIIRKELKKEINRNILYDQLANLYLKHKQYTEELIMRKKILDSIDYSDEKKAAQCYYVFNCYQNLGDKKGQESALLIMEKDYGHTKYSKAVISSMKIMINL